MYCRSLRISLLKEKIVAFTCEGHRCRTHTVSDESNVSTDGDFRVLTLYPELEDRDKRKAKKSSSAVYKKVMPPREKRMQIRHDWPSVWPMAQSFRPSVVPLPLHQGYVQKKAPPGKYANAELMKIPNFLHLTPPAIKKQCAAIKKFCTDWPKELNDKKCEEYFPMETVTTTYCHSAPTIRDERSRIVTLKIKLGHLNLDYHARDKILKLAGKERYDLKNDTLVLVADRCPLRKQNYDYVIYLLAALYHESQVCEPWESEITEADQLDFFFEGSRHEAHIIETVKCLQTVIKDIEESEDLAVTEKIKNYGLSVEKLINDGEDEENLEHYKKSVSELLKLSS